MSTANHTASQTPAGKSRHETLANVAMRHERLEADSARQAVRAYQKGNLPAAMWLMERAATDRHLAHEAWDTCAIAVAAQQEYLEVPC
ncbi:hypothetical protein [Arthrobacter flavus]|uniref:Uncharacterized protein n=1 Tax=Arthrobacter flavus TaxID=95172 RepID=A0ABW4Q5G8_9MICC